MANLSYCRFQNTYKDMRDCVSNQVVDTTVEAEAKIKLYQLCEQFVNDNDIESLREDLRQIAKDESEG